MASPYDKILDMIDCLDLQDDGIVMNHKINSIETDFCQLIKDEQMLSDSMEYMNDKVLNYNEASLKFALLFSSKKFDSLAMNKLKVRYKMINLLEINYKNADKYRKDDRNRLYNSITLLGEYYHRVRFGDGSPISILGKSLLSLLTQELIDDEITTSTTDTADNYEPKSSELNIDLKLAKLILSQVTLNGSSLRECHKNELNTLLFNIRRVLIEHHSMKSSIKALLLMTLDLYYSNFTSLSPQLEEMYTKYLVEEEKLNRATDLCVENHNNKVNDEIDITAADIPVAISSKIELTENSDNLQNTDNDAFNLENGNDISFDIPVISNKKWSEQVCEDSMYEEELLANNYCDNNEITYQSLPPQPSASMLATNNEKIKPSSNSPKSTADNQKSSIGNHQQHPRYQQHKQHWGQNSNRYNRQSASCDDDRSSVRSEGGSIKLYNVGDRLRQGPQQQQQQQQQHHHNYSRNSRRHDNWDSNSGYHTYDGRRRSNSRNSNFENGGNSGYNNNNNKHNNRNNYDRPPRFRNAEQSWRNNYTNSSQNEQMNRPPSGGPDSRSSSKNRTLPRPNRHSGNFENYNGGGGGGPPPSISPENAKRSYHKEGNYRSNNGGLNTGGHFNNQTNHQGQQHKQTRNFGRSNNYSNRYGSNNSLSSDGNWGGGRRSRQGNNTGRNMRGKSQDWDESRNIHEQPNDNWKKNPSNANIDPDAVVKHCSTDEIAKNARNTTEYMQYLSQK